MSCIDAAIIKALVEHIGGNPDDVHTGGSNTGVDWSSLTNGNIYRITKNSENRLVVNYVGASGSETRLIRPIIGKFVETDGAFQKFMFFPPTSKNKAFFAYGMTTRNIEGIIELEIISGSVEKSDEGYVLPIGLGNSYTEFILSDVGANTVVDDFMIQAYLMYLHAAVNPQE